MQLDCRGRAVLFVFFSCLGMILRVDENVSPYFKFPGSSLSLFWTFLNVSMAFTLML